MENFYLQVDERERRYILEETVLMQAEEILHLKSKPPIHIPNDTSSSEMGSLFYLRQLVHDQEVILANKDKLMDDRDMELGRLTEQLMSFSSKSLPKEFEMSCLLELEKRAHSDTNRRLSKVTVDLQTSQQDIESLRRQLLWRYDEYQNLLPALESKGFELEAYREIEINLKCLLAETEERNQLLIAHNRILSTDLDAARRTIDNLHTQIVSQKLEIAKEQDKNRVLSQCAMDTVQMECEDLLGQLSDFTAERSLDVAADRSTILRDLEIESPTRSIMPPNDVPRLSAKGVTAMIQIGSDDTMMSSIYADSEEAASPNSSFIDDGNFSTALTSDVNSIRETDTDKESGFSMVSELNTLLSYNVPNSPISPETTPTTPIKLSPGSVLKAPSTLPQLSTPVSSSHSQTNAIGRPHKVRFASHSEKYGDVTEFALKARCINLEKQLKAQESILKIFQLGSKEGLKEMEGHNDETSCCQGEESMTDGSNSQSSGKPKKAYLMIGTDDTMMSSIHAMSEASASSSFIEDENFSIALSDDTHEGMDTASESTFQMSSSQHGSDSATSRSTDEMLPAAVSLLYNYNSNTSRSMSRPSPLRARCMTLEKQLKAQEQAILSLQRSSSISSQSNGNNDSGQIRNSKSILDKSTVGCDKLEMFAMSNQLLQSLSPIAYGSPSTLVGDMRSVFGLGGSGSSQSSDYDSGCSTAMDNDQERVLHELITTKVLYATLCSEFDIQRTKMMALEKMLKQFTTDAE